MRVGNWDLWLGLKERGAGSRGVGVGNETAGVEARLSTIWS